MPVPLMKGGQRPRDGLQVYSMLNIAVFQNIGVIVQGKEIVVAHAAVGEGGKHSEEQAHGGNLPRLMGCGSIGNGLSGRRIG